MNDKTMSPGQLPEMAAVMVASPGRRVASAEALVARHRARPIEPANPFAAPPLRSAHISPDTDRPREAREATQDKDPIVRSLCSALDAAEQSHDRPCADALRQAIAIRRASLLELRTPADTGDSEPKVRPVRALQKWRLKRVVEYIDNHPSSKITLLDLAAVAGLSRMHFASQFRKATGVRPHEYLLTRRIRRAEELLRDSAMPIVEIALTVGFQTQAHFTTVFKRLVGCTPCRWRAIDREAQADDLNRLEAPLAPAE